MLHNLMLENKPDLLINLGVLCNLYKCSYYITLLRIHRRFVKDLREKDEARSKIKVVM